MARGRKSIEINESDLISAVQMAEKDGPLENRGVLWEKVKGVLAEKGISVSTTFIYQKVKAFGINVTTPMGQKGRAGGNPNIGNIPRTAKIVNTKEAKESILAMKSRYDTKYHKKIDRLKRRSWKSAVYLMCLDCCGHESSEVSKCSLKACPLWLFRKRTPPDETT